MAAKPLNKKLYAKAKSLTKKKFKVYPSAYANAWLSHKYKELGGKYGKSGKKGTLLKKSLRKIKTSRKRSRRRSKH